jgi:ribonuclease BN (tRNA processing enzyme)
MKLTVLGGSHAAVNPGAGSSGYLVSHNETTIAVDLGPNTMAELRKHTDHRMLDGVLLSHCHIDHFFDIITLRLAINYNAIRVDRKIPVYLPAGAEELLNEMVAPVAKRDGYDDYFFCFDFHEYDPHTVLQIGTISVTFAPTSHSVPGWAMRFAGDGESRDLVFTSDTGPTSNLAPFVAGAHVLLTEATYGIDPKREMQRDIRFHMTLGEALALANGARAQILVLTHTAIELKNETYVEYASSRFNGPVHLATPGLVIDWDQA